VVPTGRHREAGIDLRPAESTQTVKAAKSHATKVGRKHIDSLSNPLNAIRGGFTLDAYIIPDYGGVIIDKPGSFRLKYGDALSTGKLVFEVHTAKRPYTLSTSFDVPVKTQSNSGVYSSSSNAHRPHDLTLGEQGLILVTAQYTKSNLRCFINGDLVAELSLGGDESSLAQSSSDIFIGGRGGEFRGVIESIRIINGESPPKLQPLTKTENTVGLWDFDDEYDIPAVYFFDNAHNGVAHQGRDGPDTHDGLLDIPMVAIGYAFNAAGYFSLREYSANPGGVTDRYTGLEKLAALTQGIALEEVRNQTWFGGTLDLTDQTYFGAGGQAVKSCILNAVINHSGTSPTSGVTDPPDTKNVLWSDDSLIGSVSTTATLNPSVNRIERIRITGLDFSTNPQRINFTSVHLANDAANGTVDNLPETQGLLFSHTDDTPVWFSIGSADLLIDPGNDSVDAGVSGQRTRAKDTFTLAHFTQGQRFRDMSGYDNDAYFFSTQSRITDSTDANTLYDSSVLYAGMGAVTSYTLVQGNSHLKKLPDPLEQVVKQTIQGITNTFSYTHDDVSIQSLVSENQQVRVTEPVFHGEILKVINKTTTVGATDSGSISNNAFNRIVVEHGVGFYDTGLNPDANVSASTRDEIVAIAVEDIKPFMLKGLDTEHTADISGGVPSNDNYIRHLTPDSKTRIAVIESPSALVSAGGPSKVLVHYDAIDLTGEVVAGSGLASGGVSTKFRADHATGNKPYLVVKKTIPSGSEVYGSRTVSDYLRRPVTSTSTTAVQLTITAPGGLVSLPTTTFNDKPTSHSLSSNPTGDITPSPFINTEDTVLGVGTGIRGYGRPKSVPSTNTPDETASSDYHLMHLMGRTGLDHKSHTASKVLPSSFRRGGLSIFDIIDNELSGNENLVLIHPIERNRFAMLDDIAHNSNSPTDTMSASVEKNLMRGRIEEIAPQTSAMQDSSIVIEGRSLLMDIIDHRSDRDFNLGEGSPVKEIGDLGTPTVTMTLGGLGQGGVDIRPTYAEHPFLPGWKDKVVGAGNASVRNDKQTSTYYASTRALTEIPLFPSMFYDVEKRLSSSNDSRTALPSTHAFKMSVDCTMATNRPQMAQYESRFAIDWGLRGRVSSIEVTDQMYDLLFTSGRWLIRCQRPSVQAVVTVAPSGATLTVDDYSAFLKATGERGDLGYQGTNTDYNDDTSFYVTIGEGVLNSGYGIVAKAAIGGSANTLTLTTSEIWNPLDTSSNPNVNVITVGMTVVLGGYAMLDMSLGSNHSSPIIIAKSELDLQDDNSYDSGGPKMATQIATSIKALLGKTSDAVHADPDNDKRYLILDGPNMEAFEWDLEEANESSNDRQLVPPILCKAVHYSLEGKTSDGSSLAYVRPLDLDFSDVALKMDDFEECVSEVIRRINMAGHPQAKNADGGSAFDPPPMFPLVTANKDTGTHMGYVRAFIGSETESRDGEKGFTIVIHNTVPGASGRNFCVWLNNNTPYAYRPTKVIGYGGLLATNSRLYHPNSFPAPLPIGADGETFVPISTFRGAPHGSALDSAGNVRSYDGLGSIFTATTITPALVNSQTGATSTVDMLTYNNTTFNDSTTHFTTIAISTSEDYIKRITKIPSSLSKGIIRVNGRLADFEGLSQKSATGTGSPFTYGTNCFFLQNVTPRKDIKGFRKEFLDDSGALMEGVEIEIIYPGIDSHGIVFFGGGHTGVTFDISDGTANDYSGDNPHHYAVGPTGFSGFQNLHQVSTAAAVLDFTHITNNDTINDNTLAGIHHKLRIDSDGEVKSNALAYLRLNTNLTSATGSAKNQVNDLLTEDLYGSPVRVTVQGSSNPFSYHAAGPSQYEVDGGLGFEGKQAIAFHHATGGQTNAEYGPLSELDVREDFSISVWFRPSAAGQFTADEHTASGPLVSGLDSGGRPWGLYLLGKNSAATGSGTTDWQQIAFAFTYQRENGDYRVVYNDVNDGGIRIHRTDGWTNIIVSKTANDTVVMRCGNTGADGLRFGVTTSGTEDVTTMIDLLSGTQGGSDEITLSAIANTVDLPANEFVTSALGVDLGNTPQANATFLGLSVHENMNKWTWSGGPTYGAFRIYEDETAGSGDVDMLCGTYDGTNGYHKATTSTNIQWLWNTHLSDVAIFGHALSATEMDEIFGSRSVW